MAENQNIPVNPNFVIAKFARRADCLNPIGFKHARRGNPDDISIATFGVKKILYVTMSNLGDALMALPAFDFLRRRFPDAKITVMAGPRTQGIFVSHPAVDELIVFDKHAPLKEKIRLFFRLKKQGFDVIVDLKNTFYRWGLKAPYKNPVLGIYPSGVEHWSERYLYQACAAVGEAPASREILSESNIRRNPLFIQVKDQAVIDELLSRKGVLPKEEILLVFPGARSSLKKWPQEGFEEVLRELKEKYPYRIILGGDKADQPLAEAIRKSVGGDVISVAGETDFGQLCSLVLRAKMVIGNDSGIIHIASYLDKPVVGIYGPTDYKKYGPWSKRGLVVRKNVLCAPCGEPHCAKDKVSCIQTVTPYDVLLAVRLMLEGEEAKVKETEYRRILVVRTDKIGDVLLSTPVLKALRDHYPMSFIAMMVASGTKELVEGNPYVDEVIDFEKGPRHGGLFSAFAFARRLKKHNFDVAVVLHPTVRVHLICFLAGIKERIGYDVKGSFFLTRVIPHRKQEGLKHEVEYNFDLLQSLGIMTPIQELYMPYKKEAEEFVEKILKDRGVTKLDTLVAINPAASCVSKHWPLAKFASLIEKLMRLNNVKVVITADSSHSSITSELIRQLKRPPIDLCGQLTLSELASLFRRCKLVVSNDSGPVHVAVAVGTPVISIFGRNQPGLSPKRWGPLGDLSVALHKKMPCDPCLAHACDKHFQCLEAITVDEVMEHATRILGVVNK